MKKTLPAALALMLAASAYSQNQDPQPTWELGKNAIDPTWIQGKIECVDGIVKLDGQNAFAIPATALGAQNDYTIEFELKRAPDAKGGISVFSNTDAQNKGGIEFKYFPPPYNAIKLYINANETVEQRGFLGEKFDKVTLVVKDRKLTLFRNGLILAMTGEVKPSALPITFGCLQKDATTPYEVGHIKLYDTAIFPSGFDQNADRMRFYSGDQYTMQRVELKDPTLPRILVVGDSISMGYRGFITEHFKGRAYVDYWVGGGWFEFDIKGDNFPGLRAWDGVLSNGPYDVVTWNASTLHMWNGSPGRCTEEKYPASMTKVVEHLQNAVPATKFIWIRCTPWRTTPDTGRPMFLKEKNDPIIRLNKLTDEIMVKHGIPEVDLYALCERKFDTIPEGSKDSVHWPKEVCGQMADEIIKEIEKVLPEKHGEMLGNQK
ncbi:MAG: SGNH/GDSL hydrolase family protein [Verrucomicrobiae bacterium]